MDKSVQNAIKKMKGQLAKLQGSTQEKIDALNERLEDAEQTAKDGGSLEATLKDLDAEIKRLL